MSSSRMDWHCISSSFCSQPSVHLRKSHSLRSSTSDGSQLTHRKLRTKRRFLLQECYGQLRSKITKNNYSKSLGHGLSIIGADALLIDPLELVKDSKVNTFCLNVGNSSFSLQDNCRSDALDFLHDCVLENFFNNLCHQELFQA